MIFNVKKIYVVLILFILIFNTGCQRVTDELVQNVNLFSSYRDIPGVTQEEIDAIDTLREYVQNRPSGHFVFSVLPSTEGFLNEKNEIGGWSSLLCGWLTDLFDIPFKPQFVTWDDYFSSLERFEVDFSGHLTPTEERRKTYFMTTAIAQHIIKSFRIINSIPLEYIAQARPLRYAFIEGTTTINKVVSVLEPGTFEVILLNNTDEVYRLLKNGEVDAFFIDEWTEASFDIYGDVVAKDFFPIIYSPVSLTTQNPSLEPVISVVQKALDNGIIRYLTMLYNQGYWEYMRHKLFLLLNDEERSYINNNTEVFYITEFDNYPISFFNSHEDQWQGIAIDIIKNLELLTDLSFKRINNHEETPSELMKMLEGGEAAFGTELIRVPERENRFIWPDTSLFSDSYALISKLDFPNINLNEVLYIKVGLIRNTGYAASFRHWYADHTQVFEFESFEAARNALNRGDIDMIMAGRHHLLMLTNYLEQVDYKANIVFEHMYESTFGFNKNETVLCSIIDKALRLIDTELISDQWVRKTYDYRIKLAEAQRPWMVGVAYLAIFTTVLVVLLILLIALLIRNNRTQLQLEDAIREAAEADGIKNTSITAMENILNSIDAMIYVTEPQSGEILFINDNMKRHYNIKGDCVGQLCYKILQKDLDRRCSFCPCFKLNENPDKPIIWEEHSSLTNLIYRNVDRYINWPDGRIVHIQHSVDMTELITAKRQAEQSSRSKSIFLSHMSHEIRTPMNAILGIAEIQLQGEKITPETKEAFNKIYESGDLLLNIINDILDLSKIETGKLEIVPIKYDIPSLINDTAQLIRLRYDSKPIKFTINVDENTPQQLIGDELRIKQVLNNILSNAFKYTDEGNVDFSVYAETIDDENTNLVFCISDSGQGMSEDQLGRLFDEYSRFNLETNRTTVGAGLGMSITKHLLDLMNGSIYVKSEPGKGTLFIVHIPQKSAGTDVCGAELSERLRNFSFQSTEILKKMNFLRDYMPYGSVLVVDDVEANIYVAKGMLQPYGLKIDIATSGYEAIELIRNGKVYDIIFMDHMMPKMDGIEATKILRSMGYSHYIIALTANALVGRAEMFLQNGFDGFISKPIDSRELNQFLNDFIRNKKPAHVIEAARKEQREKKVQHNSKIIIDSRVKAFFIKDAKKAINVLENMKNNDYALNDPELFITTVHGIKSVLAVMGEKESSNIAKKLEQAGVDNDLTTIKKESPLLANALEGLIEKFKQEAEEYEKESSGENLILLQNKLSEIITACAEFETSKAKAALDELSHIKWPDPLSKDLENIAEFILHSAFKKASALAQENLEKLSSN